MGIKALVANERFEVILCWKAGGKRDFILFIFPRCYAILFFVTMVFLVFDLVPTTGKANEAFWMPPVFAATASFSGSQPQTLEHSPFFFMRIILFVTATESIPEILIVLVILCWELRVHTLCAGPRVSSECTRRSWGKSSCPTVAHKAPLVEEFNQGMFAMTRDGARVTDGCGIVWLVIVGGRRIAGETGKQSLSKGA
jgi:hypothetical protein